MHGHKRMRFSGGQRKRLAAKGHALVEVPEGALGNDGGGGLLHGRGVDELRLVRYLVFVVIDLWTSRVEIAGIVPVPNGLWMRRAARI